MKRIFWRSFFSVVNPFRKAYWFIVRPKTKGVKCVIEWDGKILLVRLGYAHKSWTLPGGGVGRKETAKEAVGREVMEEVGILVNNLEKIDEYESRSEYKRDTVEVFHSRVNSGEFKVDGIEIMEAFWCDKSLDDLPKNVSPRLKLALSKYGK